MVSLSSDIACADASQFPLNTPIVSTLFRDKYGAEKRNGPSTWSGIVEMASDPRVYPTKAATPFIKLAAFGEQASPNGSLKTGDNMGRVYGIEADYDDGKLSPAEAAALVRARGIECLIVTTSSHSTARPRWRALCPLARPCSWIEARAHVGVLNEILGGILAGESFTIAQGYHIGRVAGTEYEVHYVRGAAIDDDLFGIPLYPPGKEPRTAGERRAPGAARDALGAAQVDELQALIARLSPARFGSHEGVHEEHVEVLRALKDAHACGWLDAEAVWIDLNQRHGTERKKRDAQREWDRHPVPHTSTWRSLWLLAERDDPATLDDLAAGFDDEGEAAARVPAVETGESLHDLAISKRLAKRMAGRYRHEHGGRGWMIHRGGVHVACSRGEHYEEAKAIGPEMLRATPQDSDKMAAHMKAVYRAMSAQGIAAALKLTESDPRIAAQPADFDADPDLLNAADCVIHLPSGERLAHDPAQFLSRQSPVNYDPRAQAPTWDRFLRDISSATGEPDHDWIDFLQRALGYTLAGRVNEELMFFMLGVGANGKSVLCNVIRHVMGNYAVSVPAGFLMVSKRDGEAATPSLATLPGARLALANEVEAGARISAQMVKVATSTDPIAARANYGSPFTFLPSHALWVRGNHKPIVTDNDEGIWRRIVLIPFDRHFTADQKDTSLEAKLMAEAPGILAWLVRGYAEYRRRGIKRAKRVEAASLVYRKESDLTGQWIDERAIVGAGLTWPQPDAYADYRQWCIEQGLNPMTKKSLTTSLAERGHASGQQSTGARQRTYIGLKPAFGYEVSAGGDVSRLFAAQDAQH